MRGLSYISIVFMFILIGQKCSAFQALSVWGKNRSHTPLNRDRLLTQSPSERDGRTISQQMARETQPSSQEQRAAEWIVDPRVAPDSILVVDRSSAKKDACICVMACAGFGVLIWYLLQYKPTL